MASGVHSVYPQIPPAYSSHTHSNSMNGSFSQSQLGSFDATNPPVATTPAPTPPPPRPSSQQQMSFSMNGGHGPMLPPNQFAPYPDPNMYGQPQYYGNGQKPQIYTVRMLATPQIIIRLTSLGGLLKCIGL